MSCGLVCQSGSDLVLLWLCHRPAATALIRPLAWEPLYAVSVALEKTKKKKKNRIMEKAIAEKELRMVGT